MLNKELIAREYHYLGDLIHVNTCMVGLLPARVQAASNNFALDHNEVALMTGKVSNEDTRMETRALLAQLVGAAPEEIAFTRSTTEGLSILAMGYPLGPGDNVVTCDLENPSNLYPWFNAARQRGYEARVIHTDGSRLPIEDIRAAIDGNTKIVSLSTVQAGTGYYFDIAAVAELCHSAGALLAVDGIQAIGRMNINVKKMGIDYLSCGGYKGLLAGFGTGFLYCRGDLIASVTPPYAGPTSAVSAVSPPAVTPDPSFFEFAPTAARFEAGTHNAYGVTCMRASASLLLELGLDNIEPHVLGLEQRLREQLAGQNIHWLGADLPDRRSGVVTLTYPEAHYAKVAELLKERNISLTHRPGYIRMCLSFYNTEEQVDVIADAFRAMANL